MPLLPLLAALAARPALSSLRGGAMWVKPPDETRARLVHSLAAFCEEHGLDEPAMRAVAKGEADDHEGWSCGELEEYDSPAEAQSRGGEPAHEQAEEETELGEQGENEAVGEAMASPMTPMLFKLGLPFLANQARLSWHKGDDALRFIRSFGLAADQPSEQGVAPLHPMLACRVPPRLAHPVRGADDASMAHRQRK